MTRSRARGQTLVIFGLLLFLSTVLVCMAMSVVMKVREKIELQNATDSTAYSSATMVARTFNTISLVNRAQVSQMVAVAGVQSLISWTSLYRAHLNGAKLAMADVSREANDACARCRASGGDCTCACGSVASLGPQLSAFNAALAREDARLSSLWDSGDLAAAAEARNIRNQAVGLYMFSLSVYKGDLRFRDRTQRVAYMVGKAAAEGTPWEKEWRAPYANDYVSIREIDNAVDLGAADTDPNLKAAMGTRGESFVTGRGVDQPFANRLTEVLQDGLRQAGLDPNSAVIRVGSMGGGGSTYFGLGNGPTDPSHGTDVVSDTYLWAEDHGQIELAYQGGGASCGPSAGVRASGKAWVRASKYPCGCGTAHFWSGGGDGDERHTLEPATPCVKVSIGVPGPFNPPPPQDFSWNNGNPQNCGPCAMDDQDIDQFPRCAGAVSTLLGASDDDKEVCVPAGPAGIWPPFLSHRTSPDPGDLFGQPKIYAILQRNYLRRGTYADPWNVVSGMKSIITGEDPGLNNGGLYLSDGTDVSLQTAVAAGVAYYHREGFDFQENANFLNPYWRATLVPVDVDKEGQGIDVPVTLRTSNVALSAAAYEALRAAGFKGFQ